MLLDGWSRLFWIGVFITIAGAGLPRVGRPDPYLPLADRGPDSSVNTILQRSLQQPNPAPVLAEWLGQLPLDRPILVAAQSGNSSAVFTADLISYLAWPRPVEIAWDKKPGEPKFSRPLESYSVVGWLRLQPRPTQYQKAFGPNLTFGSDRPLPE